MPLVRGKQVVRNRANPAMRGWPKLDPRDPINKGLLAYWSLDGGTIAGTNIADLSGHGLSATISGQTLTTGKIGHGLTFTTNTAAFSDATLPSGSAPRSVALWVNPAANGGFFSYGTNSSHACFCIGRRSAGTLVFDNQGGGFYGNAAINLGTWYHIAVTYDGTTTFLYVNGALDNSSTVPLLATVLSTGLLGGFTSGFIGTGNCTLDDVRVWNRTLTPGEIRRIAANATGSLGLLAPRRKVGAAITSITGTLSATQADQTISAAGGVTVTGTLARTEVNDTIVAAGGIAPATATLALTQANQTLVAAGGPVVAGHATITEALDTIAAAGGVTVTGTLNTLQAFQTLAATGAVIVGGALNATQAAQTLSAAGGPRVGGTLVVNQAAQTLAATGTVLGGVVGSLSLTQAAQTLAAAGFTPFVSSQARVLVMA